MNDLHALFPAIEADEINCYGRKSLHWASKHEPATTQHLTRRT